MTHDLGLFARGFAPEVPPPNAIASQPSSVAQLHCTAAEAIGGQRVVFVDQNQRASYANPSMLSGVYAMGVTYHSAALDEELLVAVAGRMDFDGWNWNPATVWLAADGMMTQTLPPSGNLIQVGLGTGPFVFVSPRLIALRN